VRPGWIVRPPKGVRITPTDNRAILQAMWEDPLVLKTTRIDAVLGVVSLMEDAADRVGRLPAEVPTLLLYGARDEIIPPAGVARAMEDMPQHVRTAFYEEGYHLLLNDLQGPAVRADVFGFIGAPGAELASGAPPLPWPAGGPEAPAETRHAAR
jgi:alpha-beta hydrolase superfamily lysophospholipase